MRGRDELTRAPVACEAALATGTTDLVKARRLMARDGLAFALVRHGRVIARGTSGGVGELLAAVDRLGVRTRGASLADKVVGKAVALIVVGAGICAVDTPLASHAAVRVLKSHGVALNATSVVSQIMNRRGDAPCPLEQLTRPFDEPGAAISRLREFVAARRPAPPVEPANLSPSGTTAGSRKPS
jgi:hypothetical protein